MVEMRKITVKIEEDGRRVFSVLLDRFGDLDPSRLRKALKDRDIKLNGSRIRKDTDLKPEDILEIYIPEDDFNPQSTSKDINVDIVKKYKTIYSDKAIMIISKKPGIAVHPGKSILSDSLIGSVRKDTGNDNITLCHRLDMNTGGLVVLAQDPFHASAVTSLMKQNRIIKRYRCLVKGCPDSGKPVVCIDKARMLEIRSYLEKAKNKNEVYIHSSKRPGDLEIITRYRVINKFNGVGPDGESVSELEVELVSGRTHQIRAHLAHIGHPVLGDGKYGRNSYNKNFDGKMKYQQLWASSLIFGEIPKSDPLHYLSGRVFKSAAEYDITF